MTANRRLADLFKSVTWTEVRHSQIMSDLASGARRGDGRPESLTGYQIAFEKMRRVEPLLSDWMLVLNAEGRLAAKAPPGSPELESTMNENTLFALDGSTWPEFLGMRVHSEVLAKHSVAEFIAECVWEMTFYSFSERQADAMWAEDESDYNWAQRVFISHASEDKDPFVRPLATDLRSLGIPVWYDEYALRWGDSLRRRIDEALAKCKHGILVLSPAFFQKRWTQYELDGYVARSIDRYRFILPIWHNVTRQDVIRFSPVLADTVALRSTDFPDTESLALHIHEELFFKRGPRHREEDGE